MDQRGFQVQVAQDQVLNVFYSFFGYTLSYHLGFTQDDLQLQIMYNVCILQHCPEISSNIYNGPGPSMGDFTTTPDIITKASKC